MNKRGYKICSVQNCQNKSINANYRFFRFPKDGERSRQWAIACHREDLLKKTPEHVYSTYRVCSDHFENRMYSNDLKNRLLPSAKPTLNLGENLENDRNNVNCANVKTNASSGIRQTTHLLEEGERSQLSAESNVQAEHNVSLEPINITAKSLQPSIIVLSANNSSKADPKIAVTAETSDVEDHRGVQLLLKPSIHKIIQTSNDLSAHAPKKLKKQAENKILKKEFKKQAENRILRKENRILKKKNAALHEIIKKITDVTEEQFLTACEKFLSPQVAMLVREQVLSGKKQVRGRRYSLEFKRLCLNWYFKGPRAYRTLTSIFYLPGRVTLNRITTNISITSGINKNVFNLLAVKFATTQESGKICVVHFDEMSLKCHLYYNTKTDEVIGFHDSGNEKQFHPAKFAYVFTVRGIFDDWKQPLAYELSNAACSTEVLKQLLAQCIFQLQNIGLIVAAVVCDMNPKNKQLAKELRITPTIPYFTVNDCQIFFLFDVPHLMKGMRNMFLKYTFMFDQLFVKMEHVRQFYEFDKIMKFRLAPKLTDSHVNPSLLQKTETRLTTQLFSRSVAAGIYTYMHFGKISPEAIGTVTFIDKMDKLFDMLNSTAKYTEEKPHAHVFEGNEFQTAFLKDCLEFFDSLIIINHDGQDMTNKIKFIYGWKVTISGVLQLWECLKEEGFNSVQTRRLNREPIENFFEKICLEKGNCLNPPAVAFIRAFKKLLFHNFFNTGNKNCEDDFDNILLDLNGRNQDENKEIEEESESGLFEEFMPDDVDYQKLDLVEKNSIRYICDFFIRKCLKKHSCTICEGYSIDHVEFEDSTIFCFFKAYQNKNSILGNSESSSHNNFIFYVCSLEAIFNEHFQNIVFEKNVIQKLLAEAELTTFEHPCSNFPHLYLKKLFFRMRLYYTLKFINHNFRSSNNPNKMIIWRH